MILGWKKKMFNKFCEKIDITNVLAVITGDKRKTLRSLYISLRDSEWLLFYVTCANEVCFEMG